MHPILVSKALSIRSPQLLSAKGFFIDALRSRSDKGSSESLSSYSCDGVSSEGSVKLSLVSVTTIVSSSALAT